MKRALPPQQFVPGWECSINSDAWRIGASGLFGYARFQPRSLSLCTTTTLAVWLKTQYVNSSYISARIHLHSAYSENKEGWFQSRPLCAECMKRDRYTKPLWLTTSHHTVEIRGCSGTGATGRAFVNLATIRRP